MILKKPLYFTSTFDFECKQLTQYQPMFKKYKQNWLSIVFFLLAHDWSLTRFG